MLASVDDAPAKPAWAMRTLPVPRIIAFLALVGMALLLALLLHTHTQLRATLAMHGQQINALTDRMTELEGWAEDIVPMWRQPV